jgi:hypothetical protein
MRTATKRLIIAAAALTAAALFGSLPYQGGPQAQQPAPTVHRDVALVDDTVVVTQQLDADNLFWDENLGTNGLEEQLYIDLGGGSNSPATQAFTQAILDTNTAQPPWSGDFNGAESRLTEGVFLLDIYGQDELNQALGIETVGGADQTAFANDIATEYVPLPQSLPPGFELTPGPDFDTELMTLANAEFATASSDFLGYLSELSTNLGSLF